MGHCKWCDKSGIFFSVNERGLCSSCDFTYLHDCKSRTRIINNCEDIIAKSDNADTIISRTKVAIDNLIYLSKYDKKGIPVLTRTTSDLIEDYSKTCNNKILEIMTNKFQVANEKIKRTISQKAKINVCDKFVCEAVEIKEQLFQNVANYQITQSTMNKLIEGLQSIALE